MGVFIVRSRSSNKYHLERTQDLRAKMNSTRTKLAAGMYPNRELQREWLSRGEADFTVAILETLDYDQDEAKTDYTEDLALLQAMCEERLAQERLEPYQARPPKTV